MSLPDLPSLTIVGSGPAAYAAALHGALDGLNVTVFEGKNAPGGACATSPRIINYPGIPETSGLALIQTMRDQAYDAGALLLDEDVAAIDEQDWFWYVTSENRGIRSDALLLAPGLTPTPLPGRRPVEVGMNELNWRVQPLLTASSLIVVGGGNGALQLALAAANMPNIESVTVICSTDNLGKSASQYLVKEVSKNPRIKTMLETRVESVDSVLSIRSEKYRALVTVRNAHSPEREPRTLLADAVLNCTGKGSVKLPPISMAVGHFPSLNDGQIVTSAEHHVLAVGGRIIPRLFAAGTARYGCIPRIVTSAADGVAAIHSIFRNL